MDKIIKEIKENDYTYLLGFLLLDEKIYPRIQIYENNKELFSGGYWGYGTYDELFCFVNYFFLLTAMLIVLKNCLID